MALEGSFRAEFEDEHTFTKPGVPTETGYSR